MWWLGYEFRESIMPMKSVQTKSKISALAKDIGDGLTQIN